MKLTFLQAKLKSVHEVPARMQAVYDILDDQA